jgi:hypothetical protein
MFGLSTIIQMNKRAAAQFRETLPQAARRMAETPGTFAYAATHSESSTPDLEICPDQDFVITSKGPNGGLMVTPHTDAAKALLKRMFAYSEDYRGASVMLKHRDLPSLLFTINAAKLTVLRQ